MPYILYFDNSYLDIHPTKHMAIYNGDQQIVRMILENNPDISVDAELGQDDPKLHHEHAPRKRPRATGGDGGDGKRLC